VLIPDPVDFLFAHTVERAGAVPVRVPCAPTTTAAGYLEGLESRRTARTRMVWLCNPHNPWGLVPDRRWLAQVAGWAVGHGLRILSDEVWSDITFPPHRCTSVASLSEPVAHSTVTVFSFSKNFGLAGLRVGGVICSDPEWRKQIVAASDARSTVAGVSVLSQVAAVAAVRDGADWLAGFLAHLRDQRDYVLRRLAAWPGTSVAAPQGTYVVFPNLRGLDPDAERLCRYLQRRAKVALVPGSARWFGPGAAGHVRFSFATSRAILRDAFDRLDPVIHDLRG
jgi:cysteine-S-conjugate beta-lyase